MELTLRFCFGGVEGIQPCVVLGMKCSLVGVIGPFLLRFESRSPMKGSSCLQNTCDVLTKTFSSDPIVVKCFPIFPGLNPLINTLELGPSCCQRLSTVSRLSSTELIESNRVWG